MVTGRAAGAVLEAASVPRKAGRTHGMLGGHAMADGFDRYDREEHETGGGSFMMGLLTGTVLGAGLGMLFAPKAGSDLRNQLGEQASSLGRAAGEQYRRASDAASGIAEKAREKA